MKTILFLLILTAATISSAAETKIIGSCRAGIYTFKEDGSFLSWAAGPTIDVLTYAPQNIEVRGFTFQAKFSPICNASMSADACSVHSVEGTVSKNGIEAGIAGTLGSLSKNGYTEQGVSLKIGREEFVGTCLVKNQLEISREKQ